MPRPRSNDSTAERIRKQVKKAPADSVFYSGQFLDLAARAAVDQALSRLTHSGALRRLARGLYDVPRHHPIIGLLSPSPEKIAEALSKRDAARIQPSGAYAANILGLTEQVPARIVFLTDGPSRRVKIGRQEVILKNTTPRHMATAGCISGTVIQALRHLGARQISTPHVAHLRQTLSAREKAQLKRHRVYAPGWMHCIIDAIADDAHA